MLLTCGDLLVLVRFRWLGRNDLPVPATGRIHVKDESLVFESPQEIDSGNYTFVLNNTAGVKRRSVWVMVSGQSLPSSQHRRILSSFICTSLALYSSCTETQPAPPSLYRSILLPILSVCHICNIIFNSIFSCTVQKAYS